MGKFVWKPRPSAMGGYLACDYRAAFDRAIEEAYAEAVQATNPTQEILDTHVATQLQVDPAVLLERRRTSPYADLGTLIHFELQDGLRCTFPGPVADYAPTNEQTLNAAGLFNGDVNQLKKRVREVATLAAHHMPTNPDNPVPWLAESEHPHPYTKPGHIDFLSATGDVLVDLKTTSHPPAHGRLKPSHLHQLLVYHQCTGAARGVVLYVDSRKASWAVPIEIDFTSPEMAELSEHTMEYAKYLRSKNLSKFAIPRLGVHCSENFCPYVTICKNKYLPPPSQIHETSPLMAPVTTFTV